MTALFGSEGHEWLGTWLGQQQEECGTLNNEKRGNSKRSERALISELIDIGTSELGKPLYVFRITANNGESKPQFKYGIIIIKFIISLSIINYYFFFD